MASWRRTNARSERRWTRAPLLSRRLVLASPAVLLAACARNGQAPGTASSADGTAGSGGSELSSLESAIESLLEEHGVPGFAGGLIRDGELVWARGFGAADLESGRPMTERTLINIGSVTKTVTATVVLRAVEQGQLQLDQDVGDIVDFAIRNPRFPDEPITVRQLLVHRSSILDGAAYEASYACGDSATPLGEWLESYFTADDVAEHFHEWAPGTSEPPEQPRAYSNVAYGLLGHLVERTSGLAYSEACRTLVFDPLGMSDSGFELASIDIDRHATPYSKVPEDFDPESMGELRGLLRDPDQFESLEPGDLVGHCLYSFGTPPDGLLRSNVVELARFVQAYIDRGQLDGARILESETVATALSDEHYGRALCWDRSRSLGGEPFWNHSGGDPGIATLIGFRPEQRSGFVLLFNTSDPGPAFRGIVDAMLVELG